LTAFVNGDILGTEDKSWIHSMNRSSANLNIY